MNFVKVLQNFLFLNELERSIDIEVQIMLLVQ